MSSQDKIHLHGSKKNYAINEKKITAQRYNCKSLYNFASTNNYIDDTG
jgi:hypothetical protein